MDGIEWFDFRHISMMANWKAQRDVFDTLGLEVSPTITTRVGAFCSSMVLTTDGSVEDEIALLPKIKAIEGIATPGIIEEIMRGF